jgi:hypothetical protein
VVPALGAGFDTLKDAQLAILCLTIDITYMKVLGPCVCCGSAFPPYAICDDDLCNELFLVCHASYKERFVKDRRGDTYHESYDRNVKADHAPKMQSIKITES